MAGCMLWTLGNIGLDIGLDMGVEKESGRRLDRGAERGKMSIGYLSVASIPGDLLKSML